MFKPELTQGPEDKWLNTREKERRKIKIIQEFFTECGEPKSKVTVSQSGSVSFLRDLS